MPAGDRHQIGAVGNIRLIGPIDGLPPVRGATDHRRGQHSADIPLGHQVSGVIDSGRHLPLQTDDMANAATHRRVKHRPCLVGVTAERPLAIDMLAGFNGRHHWAVMIRHLHTDRDEIHVGMLRELSRVRERERDAIMSSRCFGRLLARGTDGCNFELRQSAQGRDMGNRGKTPAGAGTDDPDTNLAVCHGSLPREASC